MRRGTQAQGNPTGPSWWSLRPGDWKMEFPATVTESVRRIEPSYDAVSIDEVEWCSWNSCQCEIGRLLQGTVIVSLHGMHLVVLHNSVSIVKDPGFDSRRYQIFWEVVGLEQVPLSLVRITEELREWKSRGFGSRKPTLTAVAIRYAYHASPYIRKSWHWLRRQAAVARSV
jgi:hypothetical protein